MDCKIFRKRLNDLIEDNISYDLKEAMLEHIAECEVCRALYEDELSIDETIKRGLSIDASTFRSSRSEIIKSIDKNKYGRSPIKMFINHLKKYRGTYTSVAAVVAAAIFITPYISRTGLGIGAKKSSSMENAAALDSSRENRTSGAADLKIAAPEVQNKKQEVASAPNEDSLMKSAEIYNASFEKKAVGKEYMPGFNTAWIESKNNRFSATLEGKGNAAQEEGVGSIIVKEKSTGQQWSFNLLENEMQQMSPRSFYWIDDESLFVIVGLAQGHASLGGNLYILNTNTSQTVIADPQNTAKLINGSEIIKVVSVKELESKQLEVVVQVSVYEDDIQNKYHMENRTILVDYK